eukprot:56842-Prymnesium_polylepis.3
MEVATAAGPRLRRLRGRCCESRGICDRAYRRKHVGREPGKRVGCHLTGTQHTQGVKRQQVDLGLLLCEHPVGPTAVMAAGSPVHARFSPIDRERGGVWLEPRVQCHHGACRAEARKITKPTVASCPRSLQTVVVCNSRTASCTGSEHVGAQELAPHARRWRDAPAADGG